jgi:heme-degrading monooxygenase HmoA
MIARIWRASVDEGRFGEYQRFADEQSLPMFRRQRGFRGVLFTRSGATCAVISLWEDAAAAEALESSPSYRETVKRITQAGFLVGPQSVEVFDVNGGDMAEMDLG